MIYNRELAKRFISDYNLPIPLIKEKYFFYHLNLYEEDYGSLSKYETLLCIIDTLYDGDCNKFLDDYYSIRDNIIKTVSESEAFKKFNTMDMSVYNIKDKPNVSKNDIYKQNNIGKFFLSVDLKKANFQTLKNIDKDIVLGADTYEDFIGKFTDLDYIKTSKYSRQVIFGKMNPQRHITAEKYFIVQIYKKIKDVFYDFECVSMSNDEIVFDMTSHFYYLNDKLNCFATKGKIEEIAKSLGFDVHVEFFHLMGYNLLFEESRSVRSTFYVKDYFCTDGKFKLIAAPLPYHSIMYKLYKGLPLEEFDYHFNYEGMDAKFCEEFDIEEIEC